MLALVVPAPQFRPQTFPIATLGGYSVELSDSLSNMTRPLTTVTAAISARLDLLKRALISPPSNPALPGSIRQRQRPRALCARAIVGSVSVTPERGGSRIATPGHPKGTIFRYRHANVLSDVST
jgi:hypothetical protein